jgi:predicted DNA-binding ribbon-helix-helix protein
MDDPPPVSALHRLREAMADTGGIFSASVKRSITIAGHATSIRIESAFWDALVAESVARDVPLSALVAQIDAARLTAAVPPNLASAIRLWLFAQRAAVPGSPGEAG